MHVFGGSTPLYLTVLLSLFGCGSGEKFYTEFPELTLLYDTPKRNFTTDEKLMFEKSFCEAWNATVYEDKAVVEGSEDFTNFRLTKLSVFVEMDFPNLVRGRRQLGGGNTHGSGGNGFPCSACNPPPPPCDTVNGQQPCTRRLRGSDFEARRRLNVKFDTHLCYLLKQAYQGDQTKYGMWEKLSGCETVICYDRMCGQTVSVDYAGTIKADQIKSDGTIEKTTMTTMETTTMDTTGNNV